MGNLLLDALPTQLEIEGVQYPINSDFRTWIRFENTLLWDNAPMQERIFRCLLFCFPNQIPADIGAAFFAAVDFYQLRDKTEIENLPASKPQAASSGGNRIYSFAHDAPLIYAAFLAQYGIDLQQTDMHWWRFHALFSGLEEHNKICKIMEYRAMDLSGIKDKEQKAFYRRMKRLYRLPDPRSEEEKEADMMAEIEKLF